MRPDFAALILTHGRPNDVKTVRALRNGGYTGRIVIVVDDLDPTVDHYRVAFDEVVVFDKKSIAETFDTADNFEDMRTIVYARNASFRIARDLGLRYFIQLDDDYSSFQFRFDASLEWVTKDIIIRGLDNIFEALVAFLEATPAKTIAMAQGGDFIGGSAADFAKRIQLSRKAMNSFVCNVDRSIGFLGRINEDVNTYTRRATTGDLLFTINLIALDQAQTQKTAGGMTSVYRDSGTYVKSFYSVMFHPSGVRVKPLRDRLDARLHHSVDWNATAPKILRQSVRKG